MTAGPAGIMPRDGAERAVMLALRFLAAATDTGDAACWDAAFERAEAEFGPRDGALLVARAAAWLRSAQRAGEVPRFLPPPCRRLSSGEAVLLDALRGRLDGKGDRGDDGGPPVALAFADLLASVGTPRPCGRTAVRPG